MMDAARPPGTEEPGLFSRGKALFRTTAGDRGTVEMPMLAPHLEARPAAHEAALLVSETFNAALYGQRWLDLLPLLDGTRSRHEIAAALSGTHPPLAVQTALVSLASKGYVVSGEFAMGREMAAFWGTLGVSPRYAEERLDASPVAVSGDDGRLAAALGQMGVRVGGDDPALVVAVTSDYLDEKLAEANRRHLESGVPWTLVKTDGVWPLFGPVFRPEDGGPCWACLAHRVRGNREIDSFLRNTAGDAAGLAPRAIAPPFADAVRGLAATEIAKWLVYPEAVRLHEHAISVDPFILASEHHRVARRPQCFACGDEALHRPDRPAAPVELRPSPKSVRNSGGVRSVPPEETVRRYRHLVSPISGVVTQLMRTTDETDPTCTSTGRGATWP